MIFLLFPPTLHDLLLHRTCDAVGWGGDNTKQVCCSATWSSCFSLLRYMIFLLFCPRLHDLLLHRTCDGAGRGRDSYMIFLLFSPTLRDLLLRRTCDGVGRGGDNTKQICCSATRSSCFSFLRYMIFYFTEHVMGWGGVGIIPNRSVAPLHDLLAFPSYATWSSTSPNMWWGGVGWG